MLTEITIYMISVIHQVNDVWFYMPYTTESIIIVYITNLTTCTCTYSIVDYTCTSHLILYQCFNILLGNDFMCSNNITRL